MKRLILTIISASLLSIFVSSGSLNATASAPAEPHNHKTTVEVGFANYKAPAPVQPLPTPDMPQMAEMQPLPEPAPAPAVSTAASTLSSPQNDSACVTGYTSGDYFLDKVINYESSGNSCATNYLGCFGLLQACPGEPLREACGGDPACQIEWFQQNKTGGRSWAQVWQHELDFGWW